MFQPKLQRGVTSLVLLLAVLLGLGAGVFYLAYARKSSSVKSLPQPKSSITAPGPSPSLLSKAQDPSAAGSIVVQYTPRVRILDTARVGDENQGPVAVFNFYKIGKVLSGKYKDADLIMASVTSEGPCKGAGCGQDIKLRYIKLADKVVFLPKISDPYQQLQVAAHPSIAAVNPFRTFGLPLVTDDETTIPVLEYPKQLNQSTPKLILSLSEQPKEDDAALDLSKLMLVAKDTTMGDIYTTKPGLGPQDSFYDTYGGGFGNTTLQGCRGSDCFLTNSFFVFRPDGTYLLYSYKPPFAIKDVTWHKESKISGEYLSSTYVECGNLNADDVSIVDPGKLKDTDLIELGKVTATNDPIYGLKDANHPLIKDFYATYQKEFTSRQQYDNTVQMRSFNDFASSYPILVWKDPLGRLIRFTNKAFIPPSGCEPIIYLYPPKQERISLVFGQGVKLFASSPSYNKRWDVIGSSSGAITNLSDALVYPYLFWEGFSTFYPEQDKGYVIERNKIKTFFQNTLPRLGLNSKETGDFITTWLPAFNSSPYYFITFYDTETVNNVVPITITPKPDTMIRIMMDFKPLSQPIAVQPPTLPPTPVRKGFTVVEWGALKR